MPGTSFKNYVVNYDLVVNSTAAEGFAQVAQMAQRMQKPLKDISNHFKRLQQSASALKKGGAFEIKPTIDVTTFDKQAQTLITRAEKVAAQVNAILNGAFTVNPAAAKTTGGKGTSGKKAPSKTEKRIYTTDQLKKEAEQVKKQLKNLYGPRGAMSENTKGYKSLLESLKGDVAKLADLKRLRTQLAAVNSDIKAAGKNGGKITKTITDGVAQGVIQGTKKGGKKLIQKPQVTEAFSGVLQNLVAGKAVQIPVSVVSNAKTVESINAAMAKMRGQVKPIVVPVTVATNIDAAKAVRGTVDGLQNVITGITPSATGSKGGAKLKKPVKPVLQTLSDKEQKEYKRLQDKLSPLYTKEDNYKKEMAAIQARSSGGMSEKDTKRFNKLKDDLLPKVQKRIGNIEPGFVTLQAKDRQYAATYQNALDQYNQQLAAYKAQKAVKGGAKGTVVPTKTGGVAMPLQQLQQLAAQQVVNINTRLVSDGQAAFQLNQHIQKLQELAFGRPIRLTTTLGQGATGVKATKGAKGAATAMPMEGVIENVMLAKGAKVSGGPVKVEGIVENVKAGKGMKPIELKANIVAPGLNNQVNVLKELSTVWKALPKTGSRTYTVNLKMPGIENIGRLRELVGMVGNMPASQRRVYNNGIGAGQGNRGTSTSIYAGGGRNASTRYMGRPKGTMNTFAYQLMGNTSLGARTPVFLDMMKGMGMMSGVGAAMSTLTNAFSNASEYQNTMVTARSILEAGYQGTNFDNDFKNMERIVRDVAKKTKFTAPQSADAARFMAMAGLNIPMINASIRPIADVAVIGDNDLGEVADKITNIQTAFGLKPNQMRGLADALTKTFTSSNTDMMMLAESMEYAAPMAHLAGAKVEDALAMIGIMGNAGIQGSMAGTTLRMMYQNVINPNKKQQKMWQSLGISLKDTSGNPRQLMDILSDLKKKANFSKDDKNLDGTWKDEGTPVAELVSKLFRVTASAGAGTLLENLDKVYALANANRNAEGLSQRISEVKQNDVKGMWAKMTSAFTDAVVTEFEQQDSPIKGYLENITKYFNSDEFKGLLHDIFDLVTSMMDMLGKFVKIWREIYKIFGPIIKYTLMAQFILTQIGYMLAPLRSIYMTVARGVGAVKGMMAGTAVASVTGGGMGVAGAVAGGGGGAILNAATTGGAMIATPLGMSVANRLNARLANKPISVAMAGTAIPGMQTGVGRASYAGTLALEAAIAKKQMEWYAAGSLRSDLAKKIHLHKTGVAPIANIDKIESAYARTVKLRNIKADEVAAMRVALSERQREMSEAAALREARRSKGGDIYRRARNIYGYRYTPGKAFTHGFSKALQWTPTAISGASLLGGFTSIAGTVGKALGALVNPITLTVAAVGALGFGIYSAIKARKEAEERRQKELKRLGESFESILQFADIVKEKRDELANSYSDNNLFNVPVINLSANVVNLNDNNGEPQGLKGVSEDENYTQYISDLVKRSPDVSYKDWAQTFLTKMSDIISNPEYYLEKQFTPSALREQIEKQDELQKQYRSAANLYFSSLSGDPDKLKKETQEAENEYVRLDKEYKAATKTVDDNIYISGVHAAIAKRAMEMPEYMSALDEISKISTEYLALPEHLQKSKQQEYYKKVNDYIESLNPENNKKLLRVVDRASAERALDTPADQLYGSWFQIYNWLNEYKETLPVYSRMLGNMMSWKNIYTKEDDKYYENLMRILGNVQFRPTSASPLMKIPLNKYGQFDLAALSEIFTQEKVANPQAALVDLFKGFYNTLQTEDAYKNLFDRSISEEDFISNLWFASMYKQVPSASQLVNGAVVEAPPQYQYKYSWGTNLFQPAKQDINIHLHGNMFNVETMNAENFTTEAAKQRIMDVIVQAVQELNK